MLLHDRLAKLGLGSAYPSNPILVTAGRAPAHGEHTSRVDSRTLASLGESVNRFQMRIPAVGCGNHCGIEVMHMIRKAGCALSRHAEICDGTRII